MWLVVVWDRIQLWTFMNFLIMLCTFGSCVWNCLDMTLQFFSLLWTNTVTDLKSLLSSLILTMGTDFLQMKKDKDWRCYLLFKSSLEVHNSTLLHQPCLHFHFKGSEELSNITGKKMKIPSCIVNFHCKIGVWINFNMPFVIKLQIIQQ